MGLGTEARGGGFVFVGVGVGDGCWLRSCGGWPILAGVMVRLGAGLGEG
jgi:hypothetical protein